MLFRGLMVTNLSGSMDGLVAAHNHGGTYFRNRTIPTDPETARQVNCRDALALAWNWWANELTQENREAWAAYANSKVRPNRIGDHRTLSGWPAFVRQHFLKFQVNEQLGASTDPGYVPPLASANLTAHPTMSYVSGSTYQVNYPDDSTWQLDQDNGFAIFLSTPRPQTINFYKGPYQLAAAIIGNSEDPPDFPVSVEYGTTPASGQRVFYRIIFFSNDMERAGPFVGRIDIP